MLLAAEGAEAIAEIAADARSAAEPGLPVPVLAAEGATHADGTASCFSWGRQLAATAAVATNKKQSRARMLAPVEEMLAA